MSKQLITTLAAAAVLGGALLGGCAAGGSTTLAYAETVQSRAVDVTFTALPGRVNVDEAGSVGPSIGDKHVQFGLVEQDDKRVGTHGDDCTVVEATDDRVRFTCLSFVRLPQGQLTLEGLIQVPVDGPADYRMAVTGGTGDFAGAAGSVRVTGRGTPADGYVVELDLL